MVARCRLRRYNHAMAHHALRALADELVQVALRAADPAQAVRRYVTPIPGGVAVAGRTYRLADYRRVVVIAFGKAAGPMATALLDCLSSAVTDLPVDVADLPAAVTGLPVDVADLPAAVTGVPVDVTDPPVDVTGVPVDVTGVPVAVADLPVAVTGVPVDVTGVPVDVTDPSVDVTGVPVAVADPPVAVTDVPVDVTGVPVAVADLPVDVTDPPVAVTGVPVAVTGLIVLPAGGAPGAVALPVIEAGHPLPSAGSVAAGQAALRLLHEAGEHDLVICLISGGGSALLTCPAPGISLADLQATTNRLLRSGATIAELNAVRKHLDRVKGGGLVRAANGATIVSLILSDVVGDPLDVIASGPTVADPTTYAEAWDVLARHGLLDTVPDAVKAHLQAGQRGERPETLKSGDARLARVHHVIVGSLRLAAAAVVDAAAARGWHARLLSTTVEGEAREVARLAAAVAQEVVRDGRPVPRPACLVWGGETTVTVRGAGRGGRNQELALAAALALDGWPVGVFTLATDGVDGPTAAAGAWADGTTVARARALGLDARQHLADNDAYPFFAALDDLVLTGPTGTNVNDLLVMLIA